MFSTEVCAFSVTHPHSCRWRVSMPSFLARHALNGKIPPLFPFLHILGERKETWPPEELVVPVVSNWKHERISLLMWLVQCYLWKKVHHAQQSNATWNWARCTERNKWEGYCHSRIRAKEEYEGGCDSFFCFNTMSITPLNSLMFYEGGENIKAQQGKRLNI